MDRGDYITTETINHLKMRSQALLSVFLLFGLLVGSSLAQRSKSGSRGCRPQECDDGEVCVVHGERTDATANCIAQENVTLAQVSERGK